MKLGFPRDGSGLLWWHQILGQYDELDEDELLELLLQDEELELEDDDERHMKNVDNHKWLHVHFPSELPIDHFVKIIQVTNFK